MYPDQKIPTHLNFLQFSFITPNYLNFFTIQNCIPITNLTGKKMS